MEQSSTSVKDHENVKMENKSGAENYAEERTLLDDGNNINQESLGERGHWLELDDERKAEEGLLSTQSLKILSNYFFT